MQKEIIVNSTPYEVRVAILEDKELVEHLIERAETQRMVGDIFKGVVTAVLPGIQAAFVDIGTEKAAFLHVSDLLEVRDDVDDEPVDRRRGRGNGRQPLPPIQDILQKGQELLVQVTKEPIATKGPRITTQISLPGRFVVIMPNVDHVGVSRKIEDRVERQRLKELVVELKPVDCALIVRTVGEGTDRKALEHDVQHLVNLWKGIQEKSAVAPAPSRIHQDVGLVSGLVRDIFNDDVDQLVLDDRTAYEQLLDYLRNFAPGLRDRVKLYTDPMPIFDRYGVENELDKTLDRKVWLKKGGYILIEQTEALVAIDVNTGRFTGKKNQEETILKTNMLAAREIARQLRLRDIGGIIVIDFIDMESEMNKKKVLQELRNYLKRDRAKTKAFQVSDLGLIEMSRQRVRPSLYHFMSDKCVYCEATGHVLSLDSVANRIERMVRRVSHYTRAREVRLQANAQLAVFLREERYDRLEALMRATSVRIDVVDDPRLHREDFRLLSVQTGEDLMRRVAGNPNGATPQRNGESDPRRRPPVRSSRVAGPSRAPSGGRPTSGTSRSSGPGPARPPLQRRRPPRPEVQPVTSAVAPEPAGDSATGPRPARSRRRRGSRGRGRRGPRPADGRGVRWTG
jgi:ribonuclease G